jgi:predicted ATPase/class 3 adenylate cyclase
VTTQSPGPAALPTGTVTFLFTDIEGSTRLVQELGDEYATVLADHRRILGQAVEGHRGTIFGSEGDALFVAFADARGAILAAAVGQRSLAAQGWPGGRPLRVRMGIHSGAAILAGGDYVGLALHQVARIAAAGHGGQILVSASSRALADGPLAGDLELRDLGEHRLKDLNRPERLFQVVGSGLEDAFPRLRTLDARVNNLPLQLTTFVGRAELETARRLVGTTRLLTLTGPGGTGKTRLALQLAADLVDDFPDGVFFVALDSIVDPDLVAPTVVEAVGIDPGSGDPLARLIDHLKTRRTLLVLDNFEQVVEGADTVSRLLAETPGVTVIVTSRVLLRLYGEQEFPVPPLGLPVAGTVRTAAQGMAIEAVRLFVERAMASQPSFTLTDANAATVADIVLRLDGLPLAIELAAARVRILSVDALAGRLDDRLATLTGGARDRPGRQQTLRGAIDWSHDLLDEPDRLLFRRFAAFAGGACLSQAEAVCGPASTLGQEVLDGLASLAEKSLLRAVPAGADEPRFAMLPTIREYALERLDGSDEADAIRSRHAEAYTALVERVSPELTGRGGAGSLDRLELDHDNVRAALDWAVDRDRADIGLRILAAIWRFWQIRGHLHEAPGWASRILALPAAPEQPATLRARAIGAAGSIAYWRGVPSEMHRLYNAALEEARRSGDRATIAQALYDFSFAPRPDMTPDERFQIGYETLAESLAIYRDLGDERGIANTNWALGIDAISRRDLVAAGAYVGEALRAYRAIGDPFGTGWALHEQALILHGVGEDGQAEENALEAVRLFVETGDVSAMVLLLLDLASIARSTDRAERALVLGAAAMTLRERTGTDLALIGNWVERDLMPPARPTGDPIAERAWDRGVAMTLDEAIAFALGSDASAEATAAGSTAGAEA